MASPERPRGPKTWRVSIRTLAPRQVFLSLPTYPGCPVLHLNDFAFFALDRAKLDESITCLGQQFGF